MKDKVTTYLLIGACVILSALFVGYVVAMSGINEHTLANYERSQFGLPWEDVDGNGCDTRNDVLYAQLEQRVRDEDGCTVIAGVVVDPYTGRQSIFERGPAFPIDHIVALSEAWKSRADGWTYAERVEFANDPANLQVTERSVNSAKSDKDIAQWVPPTGECNYLARYVSVKDKYNLSYDVAEVEKIDRLRLLCK